MKIASAVMQSELKNVPGEKSNNCEKPNLLKLNPYPAGSKRYRPLPPV